LAPDGSELLASRPSRFNAR